MTDVVSSPCWDSHRPRGPAGAEEVAEGVKTGPEGKMESGMETGAEGVKEGAEKFDVLEAWVDHSQRLYTGSPTS